MAEIADRPPGTKRLVLGLVTVIAGLWTAGVVVAPWLTARDLVIGHWLRWIYRPGCHQIADRCLDLGFGPLAVCARCAGLYIGGTLGLSWTTIHNRPNELRPLWLAIVAAPTVLDFAAGQLGLPSLGNWARCALAVPFGLVAALFLGDAVIEIVRQNTRADKPEHSQRIR
jgi:uncharacterized membrane protein